MADLIRPSEYPAYVGVGHDDDTASVVKVATDGGCYADTADGRKYHVALPSARRHEDSQFMLEAELDEFFAGVAIK